MAYVSLFLGIVIFITGLVFLAMDDNEEAEEKRFQDWFDRNP